MEGSDVEITFRYITDEDLQQIYSLLQQILHRIGKIYLSEYIFMMLKEILVNSIVLPPNENSLLEILSIQKDKKIIILELFVLKMKLF